MKKNIKDLAMRAGMTGMAALSMAGALAGTAFAAEGDPVKGTNTTEAVTYHKSTSTGDLTETNEGAAFDATGKDQLMDVTDGAFGGKVNKATKVVVEQASSVAVEVPFKITLEGKKADAATKNKADYKVRVKGDIDGLTQVNVVPNTATTVKKAGMIGEAAAQDDNYDKASEGTFKMFESAGVKKAITAHISQDKKLGADDNLEAYAKKIDGTRWTMAQDGTEATGAAAAFLDKTKGGTVYVDNLSAGKWENDISFDISATKIDADYAKTTVNVGP